VQLANRALLTVLGPTADPRGRTLMEAFRRHELKDLVERAIASDSAVRIELETNDGTPRFFEVSATPVRNRERQIQGVILLFHDLTRVRRLESTQREFVANVSHELRTPLSMIHAAVETLLDGPSADAAAQERFLLIIRRHSDRLAFLVEDLLTLSALESARVAFIFERVELRPLAARVLEDQAAQAAERQITLENRVPEGLGARADLVRLQQVFTNLANNAIKYGKIGGRVQLHARALEDGRIECTVKDDGPGLPAEAVERVFDRFYRVDRGRSREQGGTGLGLAIVRQIVETHGGRAWAESQLGQGATFFFTLPGAASPAT
jgi:two-component system phosphate regulon sensor histidine kinase PhoR